MMMYEVEDPIMASFTTLNIEFLADGTTTCQAVIDCNKMIEAFPDEDEIQLSITEPTDEWSLTIIIEVDRKNAAEIIVWTEEESEANEVLVFINNYYRRGLRGMPFGGTKASGYGREHTLDTLKDYGWTKLMTMPSGLGPLPVWPGVDDAGL